MVAIAAVVLAGGGYWYHQRSSAATAVPHYTLATIGKGTIVATVSGSGQVSSSNQLDVKPDVSGDIVFVGVKEGQDVAAGDILVRIDDTDARKAVSDAEISLQTAQLSLDKLKEPADALSVMQSENSLAQANESRASAIEDLSSAYDDGFNDVSNAFLDLPAIVTGLQNILYGTDASSGQQANIDYYSDVAAKYDEKVLTYKTSAGDSYQTARQAFDRNMTDYKTASRYSSRDEISALILETYETSKKVSEAVKAADNLIRFYEDKLTERGLKPKTQADTHLSSIAGYTGRANSLIGNLLGASRAIQSAEQSIVNADRSIAERTSSLAKLKAAPDALDLRTAELNVDQRRSTLQDLRDKLVDYTVRSPIDGAIAKFSVKKGDQASSGTAVATIIAKKGLATFSQNEVDIAKVKLGQKATLSFDAVPDLTMTGEVTSIDTLGTVSQGVVNYNIKISFDTQDSRIKPGMSVSGAIIVDTRVDVLIAPNAAVKSGNGSYHVEMIDGVPADQTIVTSAAAPRRQTVGIGLANDESTEILTGLKVGDRVVTKTTTSTAAASATAATGNRNVLGIPTGGAAVRVGGGFRPD